MLSACARHASTSGAAASRLSLATVCLARLPKRLPAGTTAVRITVARASGRCVALGLATLSLPTALRLRRAQCSLIHHPPGNEPWLLVPKPVDSRMENRVVGLLKSPVTFLAGVYLAIRLTLRAVWLVVLFTPLAVTYPVASRASRLEDWWWTWAIWVVQISGPTFIKLGQWMSTRRDVFDKMFCDRLSVLHTKTRRTRYFTDCERTIDELFGAGFMKKHRDEVFTKIQPFSIGSGCIAQVYRATVNLPAFERATGRRIEPLQGQDEVEIAIKVAERGVEQQMEQDLSLIRTFASLMLAVVPSMRFVDPLGAINQFEMVLRRQVDLSVEARALQKFAENFDATKTGIKFPVVLAYSRNAIVETFEEGIYINRLIADAEDPELKSKQSPTVRRRIALLGARALLKMIFVDNFVHGDLHPGNILIRFNDNVDTLPGVHKAYVEESFIDRVMDSIKTFVAVKQTPRIRFTHSPYTEDEPTLVLLDTGIAMSETPSNLRNLRDLFWCMVEKKGYEVGELLLNRTEEQHCKDRDQFCRQVEELVIRAREAGSLRKLNISALLSQLFSIVAEHKVKLDTSFTSVILSVMVLEGFGRSLDPDLDLFQCARPYLINVLVG